MLEKYFIALSGRPEETKVDLHMHSTVSDGTWTPAELVRNVKEAVISIFALTDHDDIGNVAKTAALAADEGLCFIPGVEINSTWNGYTYHILGLGIDTGNQGLCGLLDENVKKVDRKDDEAVAYLEKMYPQISNEEFKAYENKRERGGWKALNYLIDKNLCNNYKDYFKLFKNDSGGFAAVRFRSPAEVIAVIRQAGGCAVLAHPGASFYDPDYRSVLEHMLLEGIQGIECYHPENNEAVRRYALDFCKLNKLLITGGSDCHGAFLPARCLGVPDVRLSDLVL